ncbi:MAG: biopolymer transporter ExbD [Desulfuromonas sp.]|nr:MAG: biopolymer transporter ExbD [Desulfuromonas sp.]
MGFRRRQPEAPRVDLTPMIDVVFLLLIFFMISTTFIERPGLDIDLPQAGSDQIQHGKEELQVYLAQDGTIYLQQQLVSREELLVRLAAYGKERAQKMTFLLMADKDALHGEVIGVMDAAKRAGFERLAIATDKDADQ